MFDAHPGGWNHDGVEGPDHLAEVRVRIDREAYCPALQAVHPEWLVLAEDDYRLDLEQLPDPTWADTQLLYVCSPGNPTGNVMTLEDWERVFALSDRHGFVIASDECYSEIYFDETAPPLGGLQAAQRLGRDRLPAAGVVRQPVQALQRARHALGLSSPAMPRSWRSSCSTAPIIGSAMSLAMQAASRAAWEDEAHVRDNRRLYREKFEAFTAHPARGRAGATCRTRPSICGCARRWPTPNSPAASTKPTT